MPQHILDGFVSDVAAELGVEPEHLAHLDLSPFYCGGTDAHDTAQTLIATGQI